MQYNTDEHSISQVTRRAIIDEVRISKIEWNGRFNEVEFLGRLFDLARLPSYDRRFTDAFGDIWQHRINNYDWDEDWIWTDGRFNLLHADDEVFLRFLCEMVHPVVRPNPDEAERLIRIFNRYRAADGWEIAECSRISGRLVFAGRRCVLPGQATQEAVRQVVEGLNSEYIAQQVTRMESAIERDPELAIGTAKEFLETICKSLLKERGVEYAKDEDVPALTKKALRALDLVPRDIDDAKRAEDTVKVLVNSLVSVGHRLAELRNPFGTGHGKDAWAKGLRPHHARLAVGSAIAVGVFLYAVHNT